MEKTPHDDFFLDKFFSDNQAAVALGMTLRSLRNKIHRHKAGAAQQLPPYFQASARGRLWKKEALERYLLEKFEDPDLAAKRIVLGSAAPSLGNLGANEESLKISHKPIQKPKTPEIRRKVGRPRKIVI